MAGPESNEVAITSVLNERRVFPPPEGAAEALGGGHVTSMAAYRALHARSLVDPVSFWSEIASELDWFEPWERVLEWNLPDAKWFVGGKTNLCHNSVDRQVLNGHGDDLAIIWESEAVGEAVGRPHLGDELGVQLPSTTLGE